MYLQVNSYHPPGALDSEGLICRLVVRAHNLCPFPEDCMSYILKYHSHLLTRKCYLDKHICPIFNDTIGQIFHGHDHDDRTPTHHDKKTNEPIYLHLKFNSSHPSAHEIQTLFRNIIGEPSNRAHDFSTVQTLNCYNSTSNFSRATVCYSSQKNLFGSISSLRRHHFNDHISASTSAIADCFNLQDEKQVFCLVSGRTNFLSKTRCLFLSSHSTCGKNSTRLLLLFSKNS